MALAELRTDAAAHRERIAKMNLDKLPPDKLGALLKLELVENLIPLIEGVLEAIDGEVVGQVDELAAAVDELIDQSEDVLHPESTQKILAVFEVGKLMAKELEAVLGKLDPAGKKRVTELVKAYRGSTEIVTQMLLDITLDDDDQEAPGADDGPGDEGDDDGDEGDDDEEGDDDDEAEDDTDGAGHGG